MPFFKKKLKIGLALGSGGAKGAAHLGALAAMREENIDFDVFAGASIGSLIGALCAKGYDEKDMLAILGEMWQSKAYSLLSALDGGLVGIIRSVIGGADFSDLKRPYAAVATDVISGKETVFLKGDLSVAIAASCAMPPTFKPVKMGDKELIDGAFLNYVPADRCVELGANVVISINLNRSNKTNESGKKIIDEAFPGNAVPLKDRSEACYKYSSVVLEPDLLGYNGFSVNKIDEIYAIGYAEAKKKMPEVLSAINGKARFSKKDAEEIRKDGAIRII